MNPQEAVKATCFEDDSETPTISLSVFPRFPRDRCVTVVGVVTARLIDDRGSVDVGRKGRQAHHVLVDERSTALKLPVHSVFALADLPGYGQ